MSNVLSKEKRQQILALGRLGWSLRRIEEATGVRRETASGYLKAAGLTVRGRGRPPARPANPAISSEVSTDSSPATTAGNGTDDTASPTTGPPAPRRRPLPARRRQAGRSRHLRRLRPHRHEGAAGVRRILGVLSLASKHGPAIVEDAATAALELGVPTYRFLKRYLDRHPVAPLSLRQVDPLIRELTVYRDLIDRRTGDPS